MSDALGPGDLVLCVNAAPNHLTGEPVPLVAGETYRVFDVWEFACPCGRSDSLLDVGIGFGWCQSRFRKLPKPKAKAKTRQVTTPKKLEPVSGSGSRAPDRRRLHVGPDPRRRTCCETCDRAPVTEVSSVRLVDAFIAISTRKMSEAPPWATQDQPVKWTTWPGSAHDWPAWAP